MRVLITGASGFLGGYVARRLGRDGHACTLQGARSAPVCKAPHRAAMTGPLEVFEGWDDLLDGVDAVVNLAGRAHVLRETAADAEAAFTAANETSVRKLTEAMRERGVHRLVHVSSIAATLMINAYGRTKRAGEVVVEAWARGEGGSATIVRPPLIYGRGAPGNMARLVRLISLGMPLPFASVANRRSLLAVENAADAIATAIGAEPYAGATKFELCDDTAVSLPEIVQALAQGLGRRVVLWPFPAGVLRGTARLVSRQMADGLFGDLVLDNEEFKRRFGWAPVVETRDGLVAMGESLRRPG